MNQFVSKTCDQGSLCAPQGQSVSLYRGQLLQRLHSQNLQHLKSRNCSSTPQKLDAIQISNLGSLHCLECSKLIKLVSGSKLIKLNHGGL